VENHKKKLETNQPKQTEIKSSVSTLKDPKETGNQTETGKENVQYKKCKKLESNKNQ
jgi:hypothetical protein